MYTCEYLPGFVTPAFKDLKLEFHYPKRAEWQFKGVIPVNSFTWIFFKYIIFYSIFYMRKSVTSLIIDTQQHDCL